jgi:hypothetical protein
MADTPDTPTPAPCAPCAPPGDAHTGGGGTDAPTADTLLYRIGAYSRVFYMLRIGVVSVYMVYNCVYYCDT